MRFKPIISKWLRQLLHWQLISKIRSNLESGIGSILHNPNPTTQPVIPVLDFDIASDNEIRQIVCSSANKSCSLDLIPTWFLKSTIDSFLPIITHIVNTSISTGIFPDSLKHAIVTPILKKPSADINELANYRPVSNLPFLSKVIEKVIVSRITAHMDDHNLWESHQSAYRYGHSTETALLSLKNDIMLAIGDKKGVFLVLLDLSAAFDTVDHEILLRTLSESIGLTWKALSWFRSYLNNRSCSVCIDGEFSHTQSLEYGVPQGSVLGPLAFTIYIKPIGEIIRRHGIRFHIYADDTQIYCTFNPKDPESIQSALSKLSSCIQDLKLWMTQNMLKLNDTKTEFLIAASTHTLRN